MILVFSIPMSSATNETSPNQEINSLISLQLCTDERLQVKFLCNLGWEIQTGKNALFMVISQDPAVTFTIVRSDSEVIFLKQLTRDVLQEMGQYKDWFKTEYVKLANESAIKVEAFSKDFPEMQLMDYYLIHDLGLYSILFSVSPKERFADFKVLIEKIAQSLVFIGLF